MPYLIAPFSLLGLISLLIGVGFSHEARADDGNFVVPVQFNFYLGEYDVTKGKGQFSGETLSETTRSENTVKLGKSYLSIPYQDFSLYLYPFSDGNRYMALGYMAASNLKTGINIARAKNTNKVDNGSENASTLGGFLTWYESVDSVQIESTLTYDVTWNTSRSENPINHVITSSSARSAFVKPSVLFFYPLANNLYYFNGLGYSVAKTKSDGNLIVNSNFNITLAGVRFGLN